MISLETQKLSIKSTTANYAVQVASVKSRQKAKQVYETLKVKLVGAKHAMQEVRLEPKQIGQQQFYRLKLGAFATKEQAQSACSQWQKYQVNCFVAQFGGLNKGEWL
jgi:cell division septation protein DedD